jgi:hypothetical protein
VKIFISYRRDDTAGRAGRLFDLLVTRFGARNVFQDVAAIEPGTDFPQRVDDAIAQSDAVLVVIGSDWLTMHGPDGTPRLDEPDDYVRREVGAALAADVRVVPVLVDGAALPEAKDLPEALRPLAHRQAVTLRDATWHQDVDGLVRRLEGEELIDAPRRRWPVVAGAAAAAVAAVLVGWIWLGGDDTGGDSSDGGTPDCPQLDSTWSSIEVAPGATAVEDDGTQKRTFTVQSAHTQDRGSGTTAIMLRTELANETEQVAGTHDDDDYYSADNFDALLVDGLSVGVPVCFLTVSGDRNIEPGQRAIALVGFLTTEDLTGARLVLQTDGEQEIQVTEAS